MIRLSRALVTYENDLTQRRATINLWLEYVRSHANDEWTHVRYSHSYMRLLESANLPILSRITSSGLCLDEIRTGGSSVAIKLSKRLLNLRYIDWHFPDHERTYPFLHIDTAAQLCTEAVSSSAGCFNGASTRLYLNFDHQNPRYHCFSNADVRGFPVSIDFLSSAPHGFLGRHSVKNVAPNGHIYIDSNVFFAIERK